ncbi:hypothetical protein BD413DRAFT_686859 [Trametes elegans]|nr:hypothetical protein BD413DRAFT_686859 [Trametes elegans]
MSTASVRTGPPRAPRSTGLTRPTASSTSNSASKAKGSAQPPSNAPPRGPRAGSKTKGALKAPRALYQHPVDTDPHAYSRADPFGALSALRRLLSSLPSRVGGCAYKLAPDEQRLAVHLLALVEPFVPPAPAPACTCGAAPRRTLVRLPTEILDGIAFFVDARSDLGALAATCRRMRDVVVPRHAEYRLVRCRASAVRVWHHLAVHRALARNVRRVEVLDERAPAGAEVVPAGITLTDTDLESTDDELGLHAKHARFVLAALARMTALRSIKWGCNHSLVAFESVWPALVRCGSLEEVEVYDNIVFHAPSEREGPEGGTAEKRKQLVLHDVKKAGFHGTKSAFGASREPDLARIAGMLHSCPNLESLAISYVPRRAPGFFNPVADDFLLCGRWAHLRSLTLTNLWCTPAAGLDAAAAFLLAHVNLEVLHLDLAFGAGGQAGGGALATFKFPAGCLPRLRELKASRDLASALLACPVSAQKGRPLETLKGVRLSGSTRDSVFLENLRLYGGQTVRRLELAGWNDMEDVKKLAECAPRLTWLELGKKEGAVGGNAGASNRQAANISSNFTEWANVLAHFGELTTFHGVRLFYEVAFADNAALSLSDRSRVRKNDEVASVLAWKCPKLRRLDHWEDGAGKVIVLVKDAERVKYEVRRVKS